MKPWQRPNGHPCAWKDGCGRDATGKSKYCLKHRHEARELYKQGRAQRIDHGRSASA